MPCPRQAKVPGDVVEFITVAGGDKPLPGHHRQHDRGEKVCRTLEHWYPAWGQIIDRIDEDVFVAQKDARQREEKGRGEQQLNEVVDAGDRKIDQRAQNHVGDGEQQHAAEKTDAIRPQVAEILERQAFLGSGTNARASNYVPLRAHQFHSERGPNSKSSSSSSHALVPVISSYRRWRGPAYLCFRAPSLWLPLLPRQSYETWHSPRGTAGWLRRRHP